MANGSVLQDVTCKIVYDLMNLDHAVRHCRKADWFHAQVNDRSLSRPVFADSVPSIHVTTLQPASPHHIRVQR
jgi:hypothetical protein